MEPTWWEKTVEYAFVVILYNEGLIDFAAPLAGRHERSAADGIFGKDNTLVLIEFKRDAGEISSELSMFTNYEGAQEALSHYSHHWIVYGLMGDEGKFTISARKYFNDKLEEYVQEIPAKGIGHLEFMEYLEILNEFKYPDGRGDGSHVSPESMTTVLGISPNGTVVGSATLHEYAPQLFSPPSPPAPPSVSVNAARPSFPGM